MQTRGHSKLGSVQKEGNLLTFTSVSHNPLSDDKFKAEKVHSAASKLVISRLCCRETVNEILFITRKQ